MEIGVGEYFYAGATVDLINFSGIRERPFFGYYVLTCFDVGIDCPEETIAFKIRRLRISVVENYSFLFLLNINGHFN